MFPLFEGKRVSRDPRARRVLRGLRWDYGRLRRVFGIRPWDAFWLAKQSAGVYLLFAALVGLLLLLVLLVLCWL